MKGKIGDKQRLAHILESIEELESYTSASTLDTFLCIDPLNSWT